MNVSAPFAKWELGSYVQYIAETREQLYLLAGELT